MTDMDSETNGNNTTMMNRISDNLQNESSIVNNTANEILDAQMLLPAV